jgi:hypothetical protein
MTGIADDIGKVMGGTAADEQMGQGAKDGLLYRVLGWLIGYGRGANSHHATTGVLNFNVPLLPYVDRILPRITITNNGSNTVNIGYNGAPTYPLAAGVSYTLTWKNPKRSGLCFTDLGNAATVDVIS